MLRLRLLAAACACAALAVSAPSQTTVRLTAGLGGAEPNGNSSAPVIRGNGRFVVFESFAGNLTADDASPSEDVFLHDAALGTIELVSVRLPIPVQASSTFGSDVSDDGNWVVFSGNGEDLVPGDDALADVYLRDRASGTTTRITAGWGGSSTYPTISRDGRFVAFTSNSDSVVAGGPGTDVFRYDRVANAFALVSQSTSGSPGLVSSQDARISADGNVVAFASFSSNLVPGDTNLSQDVFVRDVAAGTTRRVSTSLSGAQLAASSAVGGLSRDGVRVGFDYDGPGAFPGDNDAFHDVFVSHASDTNLLWASRGATGNGGNGNSSLASIAGNGRHVLFRTLANDLVEPEPTPGAADLVVKDLETNAIEIVSLSSTGVPAVGGFPTHSISDDARFVAFECSQGLVPGDADFPAEIYVRDRGEVVYTTPCAGDGWSAPCLCGNPGSLGNGCENYGLTGGVRLSARGSPSLANDTLRLDLTGFLAMPTPIAFVQGDAVLNGGIGAPFGDGVQCAGGSTVRFGRRVTSNGASAYGSGIAGDAPLSFAGHVVAPGTRYYQCVYFNFGSFCGQVRRNWSNSIAVVWGA